MIIILFVVCLFSSSVVVASCNGQDDSRLPDKRGSVLWFGFSGGLFRFNGEVFVHVSKEARQEEGLLESIQLLESPGGWNVEQIKFPLSFAPSIEFNGIEDIRFAPGWSRPDSPEFWTYKFVWEIDEDPKLTEERISGLLETYFAGLARAVSGGGELEPEKLAKPIAVFVQDGEIFKGKVRLFDAFSTKDWIRLNAKVSGRKSGAKHLVVFELSPKSFDHEVWAALENVRLISGQQIEEDK